MAHPIERPGGIRLFPTQYIRVTRGMLNEIGTVANQTLFDLLAARLFGGRSGVLGDDLRVTDAGGGLIEVAPGVGFLHDDDEDDPYAPVYKPIVVGQAITLPLEEADDTDDRIDVVSVAPHMVDGEAEEIWVGSPNGLSPAEVDTLRSFSAAVVVTTGTPGDGAPATPAGHLKLAEVTVLAADAGIVIEDFRNVIVLGGDVRPLPGDRVIEGLTPSAVGFTAAEVAAGIAEVGGYRMRFDAAGPFEPEANSTGATRYDPIVAQSDGTIAMLVGGSSQPTQADVPEGTLLLGIAVVNLVGAVQAVLDRREFGLIGAAEIKANAVGEAALEDGAVTTTKIANNAVSTSKMLAAARPAYVQLSVGTAAPGNPRPIDVQLVDGSGSPLSREVVLWCRCLDGSSAAQHHVLSETGAGTPLTPAGETEMMIRTSASGTAQITVTPAASGASAHLFVALADTMGGGGSASWTT